jgi:hypothetical protein
MRGRLRNLLVLVLLLVLFAECVGLPHVRTQRGYWSVTGMRPAYTGEQPLVLLLPLPKHTWDYAGEWITGARHDQETPRP